MENKNKSKKVVVISFADTFLAKSLIAKLADAGIQAAFSHTEIEEMGRNADDMVLAVLFMSGELENVPETLVYLKDVVQDKRMGLILIGEESQYQFVKKMIPETEVMAWFNRPLDMERLVKRISMYLDDATKKSVLIVDDDITYMRTVYEWLKGTYRVGMALNGVQAISYLARNHVDLILLDYEMPIANGPQVMSMLKNDSETGEVPVMFLTGRGDKDSVLSVVGLKPVDYLLKTINKRELLERINSFFSVDEYLTNRCPSRL